MMRQTAEPDAQASERETCTEQRANDPILTHLATSIEQAKACQDPNAQVITLATTDTDGQPTARIVQLREIGATDGAILILCSQFHQKYRHLTHNSRFELLCWYPSIGHQYRIRGTTWTPADESVLQACWNGLPTAIQKVDVSYTATTFCPGHCQTSHEFRDRVKNATVKEESRPAHVVAIWLHPERVERMVTSSSDRLHDRVVYTKGGVDRTWFQTTVIP